MNITYSPEVIAKTQAIESTLGDDLVERQQIIELLTFHHCLLLETPHDADWTAHGIHNHVTQLIFRYFVGPHEDQEQEDPNQ